MATLRFGSFELDQRASELRRGGIRLRLRAQPLRVLQLLVEHAGHLVTRVQLQERLWPDDTFVASDLAINKAVSELRAVLGDSAAQPRFIETLSKRGYRFVCPVSVIAFSGPHGSESALGEAHRACRIGRYLWSRRTLPDLHASIRWFHQSLELEERCAVAHAGLADAHVLLGIWGLQPHDVAFAAARRSADRGLALDQSVATSTRCR
jgi:DNA-binding winged helix-turn-helix (wHTH) protein